MEFWNSTLTEKSWKILLQLKEKKFDFIVIGGWAAYLWTSLHKSKDIDIAVKDFDGLASQYFMSEKPLFKKKNYYINVIGDFIIEVWISNTAADEIEDIYKSSAELTDEVKNRFLKIAEKKGRTKIVISRNLRKSSSE